MKAKIRKKTRALEPEQNIKQKSKTTTTTKIKKKRSVKMY